jgi:hypothetical protein
MISSPSLAQVRPSRRRLLSCVALAVLVTLLNCFKPLHIDDAAYYCYASQIAESPLTPYGFEILWGQQPCPANKVLAPPLLLYWWAAGVRLFGDSPFLWKLWLLPVALLLVGSLHTLLRRFARGLDGPLMWLIVLSPSLLPGFNLMLDVPALALELAALALFLRACDRDSVKTALLAGVVAGLAAQTKYTALVTPALFLLQALLSRQVRLGLAAAAPALLLFVGWEVFVALQHGQSHLLANTSDQYRPLWDKFGPLLRALLGFAGGLATATALLGLAALGLSRRGVVAVALVVLPACLLANVTVYRLLGVLLCGTLAVVAWRLLKGGATHRRRVEWFLVLWLLAETASYFVLTPYPAARRVLGVIVAATVLAGRLASRTCRRAPDRAVLVHAATASGVVLGLILYAVDLCEATAAPRATAQVARRVESERDDATVWYVGSWGLKFYAERAGMRPVLPNRSRLQAGDWLIVPATPMPRQRARLADAPLTLVDRVTADDALPLRTVGCYYGGNVPLERHRGPRLALKVYRVLADFTP